MDLETMIGIACLVLSVIFRAIYRYCDKNVKLTYKDQRVGGGRHG